MRGCNTPVVKTVSDTTYIKSWETVHDTPKVEKIKGEPIYVYQTTARRKDTIYIDRPAHVDTPAILADYYSRVYYTDTAKVKFGRLIIRDTVTRNRLAGRSIISQLEFPDITTTKTITPAPKRELYVGGIIGYQVGIGALYKDRKDQLFGVSMSLTQHGTLLGLSYYRKISIHL